MLPPDITSPPYTVYGSRQAQFIAELPESTFLIHREFTTNYYNMLQQLKGQAEAPSASSSAKPGHASKPTTASTDSR